MHLSPPSSLHSFSLRFLLSLLLVCASQAGFPVFYLNFSHLINLWLVKFLFFSIVSLFFAYNLLLPFFLQLHLASLHFSITQFPFRFFPACPLLPPIFPLPNPFFNLSPSSHPLPSLFFHSLNFPSRFFPCSISPVQLPSNSPSLLSPSLLPPYSSSCHLPHS